MQQQLQYGSVYLERFEGATEQEGSLTLLEARCGGNKPSATTEEGEVRGIFYCAEIDCALLLCCCCAE